MARIVTAAPTAEALTAADVQAQVKAYDDEMQDQAAYYALLIAAAREAAEGELLRPLLPQTCKVTQDEFGDRVRLWQDVTDVTSVTYLQEDGTRVTLDSSTYRLRDAADLVPVGCWPKGSGIEVTFTAGAWAEPDAVPASIKAWMLLHIGGLDANRAIAGGVQTYALPANVTDLYLRRWAAQVI